MRSFGRTLLPLVVAAAVFFAWPQAINATFPCVELGRGRTTYWEPAWWAALLVVLGIVRRRPFVRTSASVSQRILGTLACVGLAAWVLLPAKANIDALTPVSAGLTAMPVLGGGEYAWTRSTVTGNAITLLPAEVGKEWSLMNLAGGIHEASEGASALRSGLWGAMRGIAALALLGRVVALPLMGWIVVQLWRARPEPPALRGAEAGFLRGLAYLVPVANLVAIMVATIGGLPEDAHLRGRAVLAALQLLAATGMVDAIGSRRA